MNVGFREDKSVLATVLRETAPEGQVMGPEGKADANLPLL